jgi:endonuclease G
LLADLISSTVDPVDEINNQVVTPLRTIESAVPELQIPIGSDRTTMANNQFIFSGPVTINVLAPAAVAQAGGVAPSTGAVEASIRFDKNYENREGFDEDFLGGHGLRVPLPGVENSRRAELWEHSLPYHHFTVALNKQRRLPMWTAGNVSYDPEMKGGTRDSFGKDRWIPDPRVPGQSEGEQEFANSDTFHFTNCTPQHQAFNRTNPNGQGRTYPDIHGLWGGFEDYIQSELQDGDMKASILAGPVLADDDPTADFGDGPILYPIKFWKVVIVSAPASGGRALKAFGFVLSQKDVVDRFGIEIFGPGKYKRIQKTLAEITQLSGVTFDQVLHDADQKKN